MKTRIGIVGYGNLGKGVEHAVTQTDDLEVVGVFTRRLPNGIRTELNAPVFSIDDILNFKDKIDVMILCGGSAKDIPKQLPIIAEHFNTVDSFDTHAEINNLIKKVEPINLKNNTVSVVSIGWDPGLFSMNRLIGEAIIPKGQTHTFWGEGVSQGHSDAIRRIKGVKNAVQYTIPVESVLETAREVLDVEFTGKEMHDRVCYVALEDGVDEDTIYDEIVNMPNYFEGYNTQVIFVSEEELLKHHSDMPHGGFVLRNGVSNKGDKQKLEFSLDLESNPMFTASVLVAYARAAYQFSVKGDYGTKTIFDVPLSYISPKKRSELIDQLL